MTRGLYLHHPSSLEHDTGEHPERPARIRAIEQELTGRGWLGLEPRLAPAVDRTIVEAVHPAAYVDRIAEVSARGGGMLDMDTVASAGSFEAALHAAGGAVGAVSALVAREAEITFCGLRPPGHHAEASRAMGFCLFNNVAVTAAALADRGERVAIVDYDAHHGNGTQDIFYRDPRVLYVSLHEWPLYPGTGPLDQVGEGEGAGTTLNVPLPAGTAGDVYRRALDELVVPVLERFAPTWVLLSAGFDGHRADPLTGLALSSGDYADLTASLLAVVPEGRRLMFLEGGYDLAGLRDSTAASLAAAVGVEVRPEPATGGDRGADRLAAVLNFHRAAADG
jgi:acetoin utilization deacetylase AcuC-like enzyme